MAGHPTAGELVAAVRAFIAGLALEGRDGFHAKVAANVLAIVERELAADVATVEAAALLPFASSPRRKPGFGLASGGESAVNASVDPSVVTEPSPGFRRGDGMGDLRAALCAAIRSGELTVATPGLLDALIGATVARLRVDNPRYATLARLDTLSPPDAAVRR